MLEAEYKRRFDLIAGEITGATRAFYTYMEIKKQENHQKISRDGHFWSGELYALQLTWFIMLGRIFDRTKGAYSIHDFLKSTEDNKGLFSKRALADRKSKAAQQGDSEWLNDYLKSAKEPTGDDFNKIRSYIEKSDKKWKGIYKDIRNKVFSHIDPNVLVSDLFSKTSVGDVEIIVHDVNKIRTAVFSLLEYGGVYWIADDDRRYADPFIADVRNVLNRL